jgi:hypothetical protein
MQQKYVVGKPYEVNLTYGLMWQELESEQGYAIEALSTERDSQQIGTT